MTPQTATAHVLKRIAVYQRVSSETQRERETIKTQKEALDRAIAAAPHVQVANTYVDDGISGTTPFALRPHGARLLADAARGLFEEVWVYRFDRVGRDEVDALVLRRDLEDLGVCLYSVSEGPAVRLTFGVHMLIAAEEREAFRARSAEGMNRAAKEGRYCGGISPYGYRVEGRKNTAHLAPAEEVRPGAIMSEAQVVRHIYDRLAQDGWTCQRIADELNSLGIPTKYTLEGRGQRGRRTQGLWGPGRIRNMAINPTYRGELQYGRRANKKREIVSAQVPALVSPELWQAAQETLARNRSMAKNTPRTYLLRGVIRCGICGRTFCGTQNHGKTWYRCDGVLRRTNLVGERCGAKVTKGELLEPVIWRDIEQFLRSPGDILAELEAETAQDPVRGHLEQERLRWEKAVGERQAKRERLLELYEAGYRTKAELDERLKPIGQALAQAEERLAAITQDYVTLDPEPLPTDLLQEIRNRLDSGLSDQDRAEIVRHLVDITVFTDIDDTGRKSQRALIHYRFPGGGATCTDNPASQNYTTRIYRRVIDLPSGRQKKPGQS